MDALEREYTQAKCEALYEAMAYMKSARIVLADNIFSKEYAQISDLLKVLDEQVKGLEDKLAVSVNLF